jgi:PAS domain S-box-containing protein
MIKNIKTLEKEINSLNISDNKKNEIIEIINKIQKDVSKVEFKTKMLQENANTSKTLFNNIISEIDKKNKLIQEINEELEAADEELRQNNEELQLLNENIFNQKNIIEEKELRLKTIIENQGEGCAITDFNEEFIFTNSKACEIFNVASGELKGRNLRDFLCSEDWNEIKQESEKRKQNIQSNYELKIKLQDNTEKILLITTAPDFNEKKEITGTIGTFRDITDRQKEQERLKQLNIDLNKYFTTVEQSPVTIVFTDINGRIEYVNSRFTEKTGYTFNEVKGKTSSILKSGNTSVETYAKLWDTILAGKVWKGEFINKTKQGDDFIERAVVSPIKDSAGKIINFVALKEDITDIKKAEQDIKASEEKYRILFEKSNDAILLIDKNKFIDCNMSAVKMFGFNSKQDLLMIHPSEISPEKQADERESYEKAEEMMMIAYQKGINKFEWIHKRAGGEPFPAEVWLTAIPFKNKQKIHTVIRDLTERKNVEQKLKLQREKIENAHQDITDSIDYAKRIQQALLPTEKIFKESFSEHFIIYKPRDIVSGDFYWAKNINFLTTDDAGIIFAAADCTGHGVPGAFLSMLGISFLNEIVRTHATENAGNALNYLREMVKTSLRQTGEYYEQNDGMDLALCILNKKTLKLIYAGANNSIYIIRKQNIHENKILDGISRINENPKIEIYSLPQDDNIELNNNKKDIDNYNLIEIKPDKQPIGVHLNEQAFTNHEIQVQKGDIIYSFSDGYIDQFNGKTKKKFKSKRFKNLLLSIAHKPVSEQKQIMEQTFYDWKGDTMQIDDILILCVKI